MGVVADGSTVSSFDKSSGLTYGVSHFPDGVVMTHSFQSSFRHLLSPLVVVFLVAVSAVSGRALADDGQAAKTFVEGMAQRAMTTVVDPKLSEAERDKNFRALLVSSFDLPEIGHFVLARHWRSATPEQQKEFLDLFQEVTILTWSRRFKEYKGESLRVQGAQADGEHTWLVGSTIALNSQQDTPLPVQWRLNQTADGGFLVSDIIVEGASMAITLRADYTSAIQSNGGTISGLLTAMRAKIEDLRNAK
jgi:phospholipid transport system substrate-binding protein